MDPIVGFEVVTSLELYPLNREAINSEHLENRQIGKAL